MDFIAILAAGVASGTILAIAAIGEIFAERSGVLNLGVEGMMLVGAVAAFSIAVSTGSPWLGVVVAMLAAGLLSQLHAIMTIHFRADQVVSGLALTFLGTGSRGCWARGLSSARDVTLIGRTTIPLLATCPSSARLLHRPEHPDLRRVPPGADRVRLDRADPARSASAGGRRVASRGRRPGIRVYVTRYAYVFRAASSPASPARPSPWRSTRAGSAIRPSTAGAGSRSGS
jgi:hypothetical protein